MLASGVTVSAQQMGSIRGVVRDKDFEAPLPEATVTVVETGQDVTTSDQGNYVIGQLRPGKYTLIFSKPGYVKQVKTDVVVTAGSLTDVDVELAGDFTEMEEIVVQDLLAMAPGSEAALLQMRFESPSLMDSISADLMSRAGASDAASALRLVAGASTLDGKTAVIRGLPDRYVSSQLNGVRLPSADEDKRAVELDQFPSAVIESIQISKTFTPDQQGDASGGAVNVRLKGIPDETTFAIRGQVGVNSQVASAGDHFLSYDGGGVDFWGGSKSPRAIQTENLGRNWLGAVGVSETDAPQAQYKWSMAAGHKHEFRNGLTIGAYGNFFYNRDNSFFDNGIDNSYWVESPGQPMSPQQRGQGFATEGDFRTALLDVTQASQSVQWGGLATLGARTELHELSLVFLYSQTTEDTATEALDTRGKQYYFPGYDPADPSTPGHSNPDAAPYLRQQTLSYEERTTGMLQVNGRHEFELGDLGPFGAPKLDWFAAFSNADLDQPDKRQFASFWIPERVVGPPSLGLRIPAQYQAFRPAAQFKLGNLQRLYKTIEEESNQYSVNATLPFEQWTETEGYVRFGFFHDKVDRTFDQESFSNFNDPRASWVGPFSQRWSSVFPEQNHAIEEALVDVDYEGEQKIQAIYAMLDLPLTSSLSLIGGARFESTDISIVNDPEEEATWLPTGAESPVALNPGDADVDLTQDNVLPSVALVFTPVEPLTLRASYAQTIARPTFKELTPILQQEFLGGPIFIGNPEVKLSELQNYDLRADYTPFEGGLFSVSWFYKDIDDPIEYVQRIATFSYTTAVNYPSGKIDGWELEARQNLGVFWDAAEGLVLGANATFIDSEVELAPDDVEALSQPNIAAPQTERDATAAPEHLYNFYLTYDLEETGTRMGLFYTVTGDTLLAGAGTSQGFFVPSIYATQYGTLNLSLEQRLGDLFRLQFRAKNLTNPKRQTVYRSEYIGADVLNTSFTEGIDFSLSFGGQIDF